MTDIEIEKSKVLSSPIIITRSHKVSGNEVGQLVESLPDLWSHTENLDAHDVHCPLSHSLDSRSKSLKSKMWSKDYSSYISSDQDQQLAGEQSTNENAQISGEPTNVPALQLVRKLGYAFAWHLHFEKLNHFFGEFGHSDEMKWFVFSPFKNVNEISPYYHS